MYNKQSRRLAYTLLYYFNFCFSYTSFYFFTLMIQFSFSIRAQCVTMCDRWRYYFKRALFWTFELSRIKLFSLASCSSKIYVWTSFTLLISSSCETGWCWCDSCDRVATKKWNSEVRITFTVRRIKFQLNQLRHLDEKSDSRKYFCGKLC